MKVLMVLTSHDQMGDTGHKTGFWLEEFASPYYAFVDAGIDVTLASPAGGQPPVDPNSDAEDAQTDATRRFKQDTEARKALANTLKLDAVSSADYDAIFYPGGHGPLWDLSEDPVSINLLETAAGSDKVIGAVCHAPGVFRHVKGADGESIVKGRRVTGFTNSEEAGVQLTDVVPFLVEDMLKENGADFGRTDDWGSHVEIDGKLITGQNPASSEAAAKAVVQAIKG
ncbi:type 1 glutamine amidotransferase domain-containing protein [Marinobacter bohaiensis]|uniref:type 1 glutamine amidotransferase domain-containing protein n=1 Tax=Marinobacter bohaiensis TaxID=2201898 RepID=UPI000DAB8AE5|nr:type 1 glutamine amidotransferase domain-containing protein [Marinobacter bohaiensis]